MRSMDSLDALRRERLRHVDFGRYAGWRLGDLVRHDADYVRWLARHSSGIRFRAAIKELIPCGDRIGQHKQWDRAARRAALAGRTLGGRPLSRRTFPPVDVKRRIGTVNRSRRGDSHVDVPTGPLARSTASATRA